MGKKERTKAQNTLYCLCASSSFNALASETLGIYLQFKIKRGTYLVIDSRKMSKNPQQPCGVPEPVSILSTSVVYIGELSGGCPPHWWWELNDFHGRVQAEDTAVAVSTLPQVLLSVGNLRLLCTLCQCCLSCVGWCQFYGVARGETNGGMQFYSMVLANSLFRSWLCSARSRHWCCVRGNAL